MQFPKRLNLAVTSACNCRCQMCSIWEQDRNNNVSLDLYHNFFSSRALRGITNLSLTGGEPTLRKDLQEIVKLAIANFPRLTQISLNSNGFSSALLEEQVQKIMTAQGGKCQLNIGLSCDGIGEVHDKVRGVPGAFVRLNESISRLQALRNVGSFGLSLRCTITKDNVHQIRDLDSYCCQRGLPIIFAVASDPDAYIDAKGKKDLFALNEDQLGECRDFFLEKSEQNDYYSRAADFLMKHRRGFGCIGAERMTVLLLPSGDILPCGERSHLLLGNIHQQSFDEIWSGEQAEKVFSNIKEDACAICPSQCYPTEWKATDNIKPFVKSLLPASLQKTLRRLRSSIVTGGR